MAYIRSVNVGTARTVGKVASTGIDKRPATSIDVRAPGPRSGGLGSGVEGDDVVNRRHHGGDAQAVYAFAREELDWWAAELGREISDGGFGENLTTEGIDVDGAVVGERWILEGGVVLRVTAPRTPCATFAAQMEVRGWVHRFSERGRTGAYLAVESPGRIEPGAAVEVRDRPAHGITVPEVFRASMGDLGLLERVVAAEIMAPVHHTQLVRTLARRRPGQPQGDG